MAEKHTAGAMDVRNIIGLLLTIYGVIMTLMGLFAAKEENKTGNINANLWAGIILLVVGLGFIAWARLKPIVVPEEFVEEAEEARGEVGHDEGEARGGAHRVGH